MSHCFDFIIFYCIFLKKFLSFIQVNYRFAIGKVAVNELFDLFNLKFENFILYVCSRKQGIGY